MGVREDQRERALERLAAHFVENGLGAASLRQLAAAAGISDRMLLYYFADKEEVVACSLARVADGFAAALDASIPEERVAPEILMSRALALVRTQAFRPSMRLWLQIVAAAANREPPYASIAAAIVGTFLDWLGRRIALSDQTARREAAALILGTIDGIAMFDAIGCDDLAEAAARRLPGDRLR